MQWGILGAGKIAGKFAADLPHTSQQLSAVGSRDMANAANFCEQHGGRPCSYEGLLEDEQVDAIYLSLPNSMHHEWTIRALQAGKHVLCEKPIAATSGEAVEMFDVAARANRVLVEAFMYRCHPAIQELLKRVRDGAIGGVKLIRVHFTFHRPADASDVRYQADLAGGALMDVGCYAVNFARALAGREPAEARAASHSHEFGVEDYAAGVLDFGGDTLAVFTCGMTVQADRTAIIGGDDGYLQIEDPWFTTGRFDIVRPGGTETFHFPATQPLYALEADAFAAVVDGADPWITADDSIGNMRVLEQLR